MKYALTGSGGFLGFHTRAFMHSRGHQSKAVALGKPYETKAATSAIGGTDMLLHLAGVNRGTDHEVSEGNLGLVTQLAQALRTAEQPPSTVVYANSVQAGNGSVYGNAKAEAAEILGSAATSVGAQFIDVKLPNIFGEHGRPFYNSVVATFCHRIAKGEDPEVKDDKLLSFLHAQNAAELLVGAREAGQIEVITEERTVSGLLNQIKSIAAHYREGEIPTLTSSFDRDLFNTYRSFLVGEKLPFSLKRRADARGSFFEVFRSNGGAGQTSFSTTVPGVTRGEHFHRRKIERFAVLSGRAEISMRRLFTGDVLSFEVDGSAPVVVDMPTLWTHNIRNTGNEDLCTMFWTNEIFDANNPDTFTEKV